MRILRRLSLAVALFGGIAEAQIYSGALGGGGGGGGGNCSVAGSSNVLQKNNGASGCAASSVSDDGTTVSSAEAASFLSLTTTGTASGAWYAKGLTSGGVALASADIGGTAILYVLPSTNGAANQTLTDSGSTTCPTLVAGFPSTCHLLQWITPPCVPGTTITTGTSATLSTCFTVNQEATAGTGVTYTLPTAASGLQYCIDSGWNGSAADTGVLTLATSASGQFLVFTDGTLSATGGNVTSGGAARDGACVYGIDSTHWMFLPHSGTWTKH